ncbi:MAG: E3 binding domain-containing protein [Steroidobacteraceae bacterium]
MGNAIFVANETFSAELPTGETDAEGQPKHQAFDVRKGITRVREGHLLIQHNPQYFDPVNEQVHYDVETATKAPGEKREAQLSAPPVEVLSSGAPNEKAQTEVAATEAAIAHAKSLGVDITEIKGSGAGGQIIKADVEAHAAAKS